MVSLRSVDLRDGTRPEAGEPVRLSANCGTLLGMWDTLERLFGGQFMPHGHCYLWSPAMVWLQLLANVAIGSAYVAISATLYYIIRRIRDVPFSWMFVAFGIFIITCGATHFSDAVTIWHPIYWLDGGVRGVTAIASVGTAVLLIPMVPKAVALADSSRLAQERGQKLEQMYEELRAAHQKARELERAKTDFYANVSHELRTPLTLIKGPIEQLAADTTLSGEQRARVEVVARNAAILLSHVNELLDVAKIEAGRLAPTYARADLAHIVRLAASLFEGAARDAGFALEVVAPAELPAAVDPEMIQRVVQNLLSNAVKHVPQGGKVLCELQSHDGRAQLCVQDNGPGVPDEFKQVVFDRFRQVGPSETRSGGTGLGLSIVKELIELHLGSVHVEDANGGGARFCVDLPLGPVSQKDLAARIPAVPTPSAVSVPPRGPLAPPAAHDGARALILVIEDNIDMQWLLRDTLSKHYAVELAGDGQEGFDKALALRPDLVVTDMTMPRMDGAAFVRAVRQERELAHTPIVVLSARADAVMCVKLLREGANDYATKPFAADELLARVANLVALKRIRDVLASQLDAAAGTVESMAVELALRHRALETANRELTAAKKKAEIAGAAREKFMNLVSHEIRTPLTALHLQLALLRRSGLELDERQRGYVNRMESIFAHLSEMMSSLLEYANLQSGGFVAREEPVDIGVLTRRVVAPYARRATDKGLNVTTEIDPALPRARLDPHLFQVLLTQLVSNAVRHTTAGSVLVRVGQAEGALRVDVVDTGPGISAGTSKAIVSAFRAFGGHRLQAYAGAGDRPRPGQAGRGGVTGATRSGFASGRRLHV